MITSVKIRNFKSIGESTETLKLRPLTLLTGANSSGKSSIVEAISFFGQSARLQVERHEHNLALWAIFQNGDTRKYPSENLADFIVHKGDKSATVHLEINIVPDKEVYESLKEIRTPMGEISNLFSSIDSIGYFFSFQLKDEIFIQNLLVNEDTVAGVSNKDKSGSSSIDFPIGLGDMITQGRTEYVFDEGAFTIPHQKTMTQERIEARKYFDAVIRIMRYLRDAVCKIYLISGERGRIDPEISLPVSEGLLPSWVGTHGEHLVEILSRYMTRDREKAAKIQEWARKFQLPDVRAGYVGRVLESDFKDQIFNKELNSNLAGLGSRQMLSIITQIFISPPGSTIMIEEPEISLHPENQIILHRLFSEAINEGKQIICTTHSPFLVLSLSRIVKENLLPCDKIAVYHVTRDENGTHAELLKLDKHGFITTGVPSFMKVEKELFEDWSSTLEEE